MKKHLHDHTINTIIIRFQKRGVVMISAMFSSTFSGTVNSTAICTAMTSKAIQVGVRLGGEALLGRAALGGRRT